ncbi:MAG: HEAT repeat domain-containing protein [Deltaproteobacteria bacterium]|nr:HEAT repeat domain-containing protein [Deltaproteobacteria bacterium]
MAEAARSKAKDAGPAKPAGNDNKEAQAKDATAVFDRLRRSLKQIALYRHNTDRYGEYLEPFTSGMMELLSKHPMISLKIDAMAYKIGAHVVFEDDSRENNIVYPLWQNGIRLLMFKQTVTAAELQRFYLTCMGATDNEKKGREDIITSLWKAELEGIEYVVVEGFKALPDEEIEEVEIEIEKVVAYLYRQLQSNSEDYLRFARISSEDLDLQLDAVDTMRGAVIQGVTSTAADRARVQGGLVREESRQLGKLVTVLFQLLELDTGEDNFEDVAEAFVQLLDALILQENFTAIDQIRARFIVSAGKEQLASTQREMVERCADRFRSRMGESQRVQAIGQLLNTGLVKDPDGVRRYLQSLGVEAIIPLLEMLETLQLLPNRRLVCDVLADVGKPYLDTFSSRLNHTSSNFVKDVVYVIDKINPPNKFAIFAQILEHPNAILRLETLAVIGRNGTDDCFEYIARAVKSHPDAQMRAQAARMLPNFAPEKSASMLLQIVQADTFDKIIDAEKKALFSALVQLRTPNVDTFIAGVMEAKASLFGKRKVDDLKLLIIAGFEGSPSIAAITLLNAVAEDAGKRHSKDVRESAKAALTNVKARLVGNA